MIIALLVDEAEEEVLDDGVPAAETDGLMGAVVVVGEVVDVWVDEQAAKILSIAMINSIAIIRDLLNRIRI